MKGMLAQNSQRRYFVFMSAARCPKCGAELFNEARFCRQCGATVTASGAINSSELPTAVFGARVDTPTTQRLDPRPTSPDRGAFVQPSPAADSDTNARRKVPATLILGSVILVIIIGLISSVAYIRNQSHGRVTGNQALVYPGAQTIVDMKGDSGRALQLQTGDSLDRVVAWYEASLKPTKTMRLTSTSVVMKNANVTATIAAEDNKTNILIKQALTP